MSDLATYLRPAFMAGGLFLLAVGGGVLVMMRLRFPVPGPDRAAAGRELRRAGLVIIVFGVILGVVSANVISSFGSWILAVPISLIADGIAFALGGQARFRS